MPWGNSIPGIQGIEQCSKSIHIVQIEAIGVLQGFISGGIETWRGKILELRYEGTVAASRSLR
jgi:hypothetical protein